VAGGEPRGKIEENDNAETPRARSFRREGGAHPSRVFAYEWQAKGLRDKEFVRVANTGLTGGRFCAFCARGATWLMTGEL
jgi:glutamate synthase domain-containing protein 3